jgi:D-alanyl-D-alanine carboxypeptidase/D-alanyl-D-alanine-endopeptidase (penicillin-binding protein 4)
MPELLASLPVAGVDGTERHAQQAVASAHLKTGSLRDVAAVAGIVLADSGRRYAVVGLINDEHAQAARAVLDALVGWTQHDRRR